MPSELRLLSKFKTLLTGDCAESNRLTRRHVRFYYRNASFDDSSIPSVKLTDLNGVIQLCESVQVDYLHLMDYQKKGGDFHSTSTGCLITVDNVRNFNDVQDRLSKRCCASIFVAFLQRMKDLSTYAEDLPALCERIANATTKCARHCDLDHLRMILIHVMHNYLDFQPHHGPLFVTILEHLCYRLEVISLAVECIFLNGTKSTFLRKVLHAGVKNRFNFWTLWERKFSTSDYITSCPVTFALFSGKFAHLQVLLEFGFRQTHQKQWTMEEFVKKNPFFILHDDTHRWFVRFLPRQDSDSRLAIVDEVVLFLSLLPSESERQERLIRCFQLLWNARKDPFVTKEELEDSFEMKWVRYRFPEESRRHFVETLGVYENILENGEWRVRQPRTLKHLCRCTIRETLHENWEMPRGVAKLPLPDGLKAYVLLETIKRPRVVELDTRSWIWSLHSCL